MGVVLFLEIWKGESFFCSYMDCGFSSSLDAEIHGFLLAVRIAIGKGWNKIWFEGDSMVVIQVVWKYEYLSFLDINGGFDEWP